MKRKTSIIIIIILVIMLIAIGIFMFGEINKGNSSKPTSTNTLNDETVKYISYDDYKALEVEINTFVNNGGV